MSDRNPTPEGLRPEALHAQQQQLREELASVRELVNEKHNGLTAHHQNHVRYTTEKLVAMKEDLAGLRTRHDSHVTNTDKRLTSLDSGSSTLFQELAGQVATLREEVANVRELAMAAVEGNDIRTLAQGIDNLEGSKVGWRDFRVMAQAVDTLRGRVDAHADELATNKKHTKRALRRTRQLRGWVEELESPDAPDFDEMYELVGRIDAVREIAEGCITEGPNGCPPELRAVARNILTHTAHPEKMARAMASPDRRYPPIEELEHLEIAAELLGLARDLFVELHISYYSRPEANALNEAAWALTRRAETHVDAVAGGVGPSSMELVD